MNVARALLWFCIPILGVFVAAHPGQSRTALGRSGSSSAAPGRSNTAQPGGSLGVKCGEVRLIDRSSALGHA
jgi:hypothetical protein